MIKKASATSTWSKRDHRLDTGWFDRLQHPWSWDSPLRTDYARRQALLEIDVLHAQALGLTLDELVTLYRIQFPILQSYENDTWYDTQGRIVCSKKNGQGPVPTTRKKEKTTFGIHTTNDPKPTYPLAGTTSKNLEGRHL